MSNNMYVSYMQVTVLMCNSKIDTKLSEEIFSEDFIIIILLLLSKNYKLKLFKKINVFSLTASETPRITRANETILAITIVIAVIAIVFVYWKRYR